MAQMTARPVLAARGIRGYWRPSVRSAEICSETRPTRKTTTANMLAAHESERQREVASGFRDALFSTFGETAVPRQHLGRCPNSES